MNLYSDQELQRMFPTFIKCGITLAQLRTESWEQIKKAVYASNYPLKYWIEHEWREQNGKDCVSVLYRITAAGLQECQCLRAEGRIK